MVVKLLLGTLRAESNVEFYKIRSKKTFKFSEGPWGKFSKISNI